MTPSKAAHRDRPHPAKGPRSAWLALLPVLLSSCADDGQAPGFNILVLNHRASASAPTRLRFTWRDSAGGVNFFRKEVPETGSLRPEGETLAKVLIDVDGNKPGPRHLWVEGLNSRNQVESQAVDTIAMLPSASNFRVTHTIRLQFGLMPDDRDGDGIPDLVDNCPDWPNPTQQTPCGEPPDAGAPETMMDATQDAAPAPADAPPPADASDARDAATPMDVAQDVVMNADLPTGNLVRNGGFEMGTMHWINVSATGGGAASPGYMSEHALVETAGDGLWRQGIEPFFDNATYRVSAWGSSAGMGARCTLEVSYREAGNMVRMQSAPFNATSFVRAEFSVDVPTGATNLFVNLRNNGNSLCRFDEVELTLTRRN